jgi:hypothetical protein
MKRAIIALLGVAALGACSKPAPAVNPNDGDNASTAPWKVVRICADGTNIDQFPDGHYAMWTAGTNGNAGTWTPLADGVTPANVCQGDPPANTAATGGYPGT